MTPADILQTLWVWTPYLAEGFVWNIVISALAMLIGTPVGIVFARMRLSGSKLGDFLTSAARLPPTFVLIFYFAYVLPSELAMFGAVWSVPGWVKAALALSVAVVGFVSDAALSSLRHLRREEWTEALYFLPAWTSYFVIIVMASSTASVIGVPEIVYRANAVIGATGEPSITLWVYAYAMAWFLAFCWPLSRLMVWVRQRFERERYNRSASREGAHQ